MFIVPNPPKGKKRTKKAKRTLSPWAKKAKKQAAFIAEKQGIPISEARAYFKGVEKMERKKYVSKTAAKRLGGRMVRSTVCHPAALAKAMRSYCRVSPKSVHRATKAKGGKAAAKLPRTQRAVDALIKRRIKAMKEEKAKASKAARAAKVAATQAAKAEEAAGAYSEAMAQRREEMGVEFNPRRGSMRKHKFGYRAKRRNIGEFLTMNPAVAPYTLREVVDPRRTVESVVGAAPFIAGAGVGYLASKILSNQSWVPNFFKGGLGNYLLSGGIGLGLGVAAGRLVDRDMGKQVMYGAATGVIASMVGDALGGGLKALAPRGFAGIDEYLGCQGMGCTNMGEDLDGLSDAFDPTVGNNGTLGDFVMPAQIQGAIPTANTASQYPTPMTQQATYEASVLSEVMSDAM